MTPQTRWEDVPRTEDESATPLTESDVYALLAHERRRLLVRVLEDFSTPIPTAELADLIATCERSDPSDDARRVVAVSLRHVHLPALDCAGVVSHDPDGGTVDPGPNFGVLVGVLAEGDDSNDPVVGREGADRAP